MDTLDKARQVAENIPKATERPRGELDILLAEELSAKLYHLAGVIEKSSDQVAKDLGTLRTALNAVVESMNQSTMTMARLTRWLIGAAIVAAGAAVIQLALFFAKKG